MIISCSYVKSLIHESQILQITLAFFRKEKIQQKIQAMDIETGDWAADAQKNEAMAHFHL